MESALVNWRSIIMSEEDKKVKIELTSSKGALVTVDVPLDVAQFEGNLIEYKGYIFKTLGAGMSDGTDTVVLQAQLVEVYQVE